MYKERWQMQTSSDHPPVSIYLNQYEDLNTDIYYGAGVFTCDEQLAEMMPFTGASGSGGGGGTSTGTGSNNIPLTGGSYSSIAVTSSGNVWISDSYNNWVEEFSPAGAWMMTIGGGGLCVAGSCLCDLTSPNHASGPCTPNPGLPSTANSCNTLNNPACPTGTGNSQFNHISGLAVDANNNLWVLSAPTSPNPNVQEFNSSGQWQSTTNLGTAYAGSSAMTIDPAGNIWTFIQNIIRKYNSSGTLVFTIGGGGICYPASCICTNSNCTVSSPSTLSGSKCKSSSSGITFPGSCSSGSASYSFSGIGSISSDANGNIWVSDGGNNRVQQFSNSGTLLTTIPSSCANTACPASPNGDYEGTYGSGQGSFTNPAGVFFDKNRNIWVYDAGDALIQIFNSQGIFLTQFTMYALTSNYPPIPYISIWSGR
jgi:streptogramin lyase